MQSRHLEGLPRWGSLAPPEALELPGLATGVCARGLSLSWQLKPGHGQVSTERVGGHFQTSCLALGRLRVAPAAPQQPQPAHKKGGRGKVERRRSATPQRPPSAQLGQLSPGGLAPGHYIALWPLGGPLAPPQGALLGGFDKLRYSACRKRVARESGVGGPCVESSAWRQRSSSSSVKHGTPTGYAAMHSQAVCRRRA